MATSNGQRPARAKILDAACALFTTTGYAATTIKQIAARACVSSQSVYFVFGNKRSVLSSLLDVTIAGDDAPVATLDRAGSPTPSRPPIRAISCGSRSTTPA